MELIDEELIYSQRFIQIQGKGDAGCLYSMLLQECIIPLPGCLAVTSQRLTVLLIEGGSDGDPVEVLRRDKVLLALCMSYIAIMFIMLYL